MKTSQLELSAGKMQFSESLLQEVILPYKTPQLRSPPLYSEGVYIFETFQACFIMDFTCCLTANTFNIFLIDVVIAKQAL